MTNSGQEHQPSHQPSAIEVRRAGGRFQPWTTTTRCLVSVVLLLLGNSSSVSSATASSSSSSSSSSSAEETESIRAVVELITPLDHNMRRLDSEYYDSDNMDINNNDNIVVVQQQQQQHQERLTEFEIMPPDSSSSSSTFDGDGNGGVSSNLNITTSIEDALIFAVVPKVIDNEFFLPVKKGCQDQARLLSEQMEGDRRLVLCNFTGATTDPEEDRGLRQKEIVLELLTNPQIAGISISIQNYDLMKDVLELARTEYPQKPIITFDSDITTTTKDDDDDPNNSRNLLRHAFVGTNNTFFGAELARAMLHLHPTVGKYAVLYSEDTPNMHERRLGFESELHQRKPGGWEQVEGSPANVQDNLTLAIELLDHFANKPNITSIISLMGLPMRTSNATTNHRPWKDMYERHMNKGIQFLCGDGMQHQLDFLSQGYVQGLIGQLPYEFGTKSIQTLFELVVKNNNNNDTTITTATKKDQHHRYTQVVTNVTKDDDDNNNNNNDNKISTTNNSFTGTNVLSHIFVPLEIPEYDINNNLIGNLRYVGYTLFAIMAMTGLTLLHWTYNYRKVRVVQVAQPKFLAMVIVGVLIMSCCLVPLGMDDGGDRNNLSPRQAVAICMSPSWLASLGFTTTFSALYAKTRRINKVFHSNSAFARVKVSEGEVLIPFTILLFCNVVVLTAWTAIDPLTYERTAVFGADGWQRVLESYGRCTSDNLEWFLIPLICLNCGVLLLANWQAFEARHIEAEFSETKYIGIIMASMLQAAVSGIPVLFVVQGNPDASYLVLVFLIFIIGMGILLVLFVPKISFARLFMSRTEVEQRDFISFIIQKSSRKGRKWGGGQNNHMPGPAHPEAAFESRWASVITPNTTQLTQGTSSWGASQLTQGTSSGGASQITSERPADSSLYPSSLGTSQIPSESSQIPSERSREPIGQDTVGTGQLLCSPNAMTNIAPAERISNMSNISGGTEKLSTNSGRNIQSASTSSEHRTTFILGQSTNTAGNRSNASTKSGHSRSTYRNDSVHSFYSSTPTHSQPSTPMQSQRNLFEASSHSYHPDLQNDDPRLGMLVFRTMSVRADGSLAPSSLHHASMHSHHTRSLPTRFEPEEEEDESFSTGTSFSFFSAVGRSARNLFTGETTRAPSLRSLGTPPVTRNNAAATSLGQARTLPSSNSARFRGTGGLLGNLGRASSKRLSDTLPSMRVIAERTGGDESESSVSTSTGEGVVEAKAKRSSNHASQSNITLPPELNAIQEQDDSSDGDESVERAGGDDSTNSSSYESFVEDVVKAKGRSNHTSEQDSSNRSELDAIQESDHGSDGDQSVERTGSNESPSSPVEGTVDGVVEGEGSSNHTSEHSRSVSPERNEIQENDHASDGDEGRTDGDAEWDDHLRALVDIGARHSEVSISFDHESVSSFEFK